MAKFPFTFRKDDGDGDIMFFESYRKAKEYADANIVAETLIVEYR